MAYRATFRNDYKIIIIGSSGVGKTSFANRWNKNIFIENPQNTVSSEYDFKVVEVDGKPCRIQLWDLAGQDKNFMLTKIFMRDSHGCIILTDITSQSTRNDAIIWKKAIDEYDQNIPCILAENKCDLVNKIKNYKEELNKFAFENSFIDCFRVSAKTGHNVYKAMTALIKYINKKMDKFSEKNFESRRTSLALDPSKHTRAENARRKKKKCC